MKYIRNAQPRGVKREATSANDVPNDAQGKKPKQFKPQFPAQSTANRIQPPSGEDRASHDRHVKFLQSEEKKISPNAAVCKDLMKRSFNIRREDILNNPKPVSELLKIYPSLKRGDQVKILVIILKCQSIIMHNLTIVFFF